MISIFKLYEQLKGRVNAHQGGHIKPSDYVEWVHEIQIGMYNDRVEEFQKTQVLSDAITPFLDSVNVVVNNVPGAAWDIVTRPQNLKNGVAYPYENYASARIVKKDGESVGCKGLKEFDCGKEVEGQCKRYVDEDELQRLVQEAGKDNCEVSIELVDNDRWGAICDHPRKKMTCKSPKMTQFSGGFKIGPKGCATNIIMDFFRLPVKPVFNFTIINPNTENEYYQFVSTGSVHLEWSETLLPEFLTKLMDKYATFTGNDGMWQQAKVDQKDI